VQRSSVVWSPPVSTRDFIARTTAIGSLGGTWYFDPHTIATGKEHNLDGFRFYFLGRGGVLGDVESQVVGSAFGYWNPVLVDKMWNTAKERMAPRDAARLYLSCCHDVARSKFAAVDGLTAFCEAAEQVNEAIDPAGLALYAGIDAEPLPDDAPARALHLCAVLREASGSAHLLGVVTSGLRPRIAHHIKRPDDGKAFGWDDTPVPTAEELVRWEQAEELTIRQLEPWFGVLDESGQDALLNGLAGMQAALA
jgi:Helix-turn-helix family